MVSFTGRSGLIVVFIIFLILLSACATAPSPEPIPTQAPQGQQSSSANSSLASLTANEITVTVSGAQNSGTILQKFDTVNIPVGDQIKLDSTGRGVLRFGDRHEIDLFGDTEILLDDAKLESGGSTFVRIKQVGGHTHTKLNEQAVARVTLETDDSSMTTLEQGTEFAVCFAPGKVTCIVVAEGSLEVISQGGKQIYRKGEFTFYEPGQQPQPPLCIDEEQFNEWLMRKRSQEATQTLSQLVASWPQVACGTTLPESPGSGVTALPPTVVEATQVSPTATEITPLPPTETYVPTVPPTATVPPGILYVRINRITIDQNNHYVVEYETFGYTEQLPGMHVHFFFNTVPPEQAGVPGQGPWILYGGPRPFTQYTVNDRPSQATEMCALVANADHSIQLNSGNCMDLP